MPLNPPSYNGQDVYYSTNVFVNKVPIALWQPPAGAFNDGSPGTKTVGGQTMYALNPSGKKAMARDERQMFGDKGSKGDDDGAPPGKSSIAPVVGASGPIDNSSGLPPNSTDPDPNPSAPSGNFELTKDNLPNSFGPLTDPVYQKRISQYFKLAHIRMPPENEPAFGLTARQVAANFIDLCVNILDPIYSEFHFNINPLNSAYRSTSYNKQIGGSLTSEHITGCAADISTGSLEGNQRMFKWILSHQLKFRQLLYERAPGGSAAGWVHISYNKGQPKADASRVGYTTSPPSITSAGQNGENLPANLRP